MSQDLPPLPFFETISLTRPTLTTPAVVTINGIKHTMDRHTFELKHIADEHSVRITTNDGVFEIWLFDDTYNHDDTTTELTIFRVDTAIADWGRHIDGDYWCISVPN